MALFYFFFWNGSSLRNDYAGSSVVVLLNSGTLFPTSKKIRKQDKFGTVLFSKDKLKCLFQKEKNIEGRERSEGEECIGETCLHK